MSESKSRYFATQVAVIVVTVLAINLGLVILPMTSLAGWLTNQLMGQGVNPFVGHLYLIGSLHGLFDAECGCIVLWAVLSSMKLQYRLLILYALTFCVKLVSQLQLVGFQYIGSHLSTELVLRWFLEITVILVLVAIALRLASRRGQFVSVDRSSEGSRSFGITIFLTLYLITLIAIALSARISADVILRTMPPDKGAPIPDVFFVWSSIESFATTSLVLSISVLIATRFDRAWVQGLLGTSAVALGTIAYQSSSRYSWNAILHEAARHAWFPVCIVLWLKAVQFMGYVVRCYDRVNHRNVEHPFIEVESAQEARP